MKLKMNKKKAVFISFFGFLILIAIGYIVFYDKIKVIEAEKNIVEKGIIKEKDYVYFQKMIAEKEEPKIDELTEKIKQKGNINPNMASVYEEVLMQKDLNEEKRIEYETKMADIAFSETGDVTKTGEIVTEKMMKILEKAKGEKEREYLIKTVIEITMKNEVYDNIPTLITLLRKMDYKEENIKEIMKKNNVYHMYQNFTGKFDE